MIVFFAISSSSDSLNFFMATKVGVNKIVISKILIRRFYLPKSPVSLHLAL